MLKKFTAKRTSYEWVKKRLIQVLQKVVQKALENIPSGSGKAVLDANHKWFRKTYQIKNGKKSQITSGQAKSKGFKFPKNAQKVSVAPKDMKYKGYTAEYWNKMKFEN